MTSNVAEIDSYNTPNIASSAIKDACEARIASLLTGEHPACHIWLLALSGCLMRVAVMSSIITSKRSRIPAGPRLKAWAYLIVVGDEGGHVAGRARSSRERLVV